MGMGSTTVDVRVQWPLSGTRAMEQQAPPPEDAMIQTVEAVIDEQGKVQLLQAIELSVPRRALVTILLDEGPTPFAGETALLSEAALAEDWDRPEEDVAWSHLQSGK